MQQGCIAAYASKTMFIKEVHCISLLSTFICVLHCRLLPDNGNSRQQEAHPDRFHDLPADASLELSSTPGATTDSNEATVDHLSTMLPQSNTASPQGSTPQAVAAAQKLARGEKLPKAVSAPAGQKLQAQLEELSSK
jgi:hypothetical protein